ncbi:hypothetical protein ASPNIDRAFT_37141 [Aspergillus niger ATCC 1015]|uniref:UDP-Glycosyltransferase/glycogen phosphorylase n=2 Tax=Aspergillus TaxID=5052 RepID=A0A370PP36_ASPPH|nr:hypothetical protein ASPNIDRAFT_37141 [Aspergillus niger ATCC 1015]RDK43945.1 UDP-Glycosyltransferase/glycogen phosphorylase [Aspergillus phoenicis ATCC 13157]
MSDNKEVEVLENCHENDGCFDDPPPAYSSARNSCVSSEISLFTIEPDFAPEFTNDTRDLGNYCAADEDEKLRLSPDLASRTSAFIQAFMRPKVQARLVSVGLDEKESQHSPQTAQTRENIKPPPLDIVLMVVEESIRPFLAVAKQLSRDSHRVRIAAAASCEHLVRSQGLDFFAITYDHELPQSMHNMGGSQPSDEAQARRQYLRSIQESYYEVYHRCWRACIAPFDGDRRPFLADAIIANPMARAHIHCAERLSIPLHIMSALPQSPTRAFPHPHARVNPYDGVDQSTANVLSYAIVEESTWNVIKNIYHLALMIQDAILKNGYRALLSRECRRLGELLNSDNVLVTQSVPFEWLLPRVAVIVHNGSQASTQLALQYGKPSVIIAPTENYLSTAQKIARIGAGASPLMSRTLTSEGLAQAITFCLRTDVQQSTQAIRRQVEEEAGLENAIRSFYRSFPSQVQTCGITKQCLAMYQIWNKPSLLVSSEAAAVLVQENRIKVTDIVLTAKEYWNGFTNAAKDIDSPIDDERKVKRTVARDVGVGTAKFFGHIALLPFTSTALVVNTVTYGVKSVKKHQARGGKREEADVAASYDLSGDDDFDAAASKRSGAGSLGEGLGPNTMQRGNSNTGITTVEKQEAKECSEISVVLLYRNAQRNEREGVLGVAAGAQPRDEAYSDTAST